MVKVKDSDPFEKFVKSTLASYFRRKGYNDYVFDPIGHVVDEVYYFAKLLGVEEDVKFIVEPERRRREIKTLFELLDVKHKIFALSDVKNNSSGLLGKYSFDKGGNEE